MDTAGPVIGVGVLTDEVCLTKHERVRRGSETRLIPWLIELTEQAGVALRDCQGVAVAQGPGAFTGVRVGLSTAAGLATSLNVPVLPVMSLAPRAEQARLSGVNDKQWAVLSTGSRTPPRMVLSFASTMGLLCSPATVTALWQK